VVNVTTCHPQTRTATKTVCDVVPVQLEVTVNVVKTTAVQKTGVAKKLVCDVVTEIVPVNECYTEMVPYSYTVKVPVYSYSCAPEAAGCVVATDGGCFDCCFGSTCCSGCKAPRRARCR
jgi:hypothetical protein